jgi:hypothetical protein
METQLITKDTPPALSFNRITHLGLTALNLVLSHKAVMDERLPGVADTLSQGLDDLGVAVPGAIQTRHESVAATSAQTARTQQGYARVRAVRRMLKKAGAQKEIRKAYGVGRRVRPHVHAAVVAALKQIVDRAIAEPVEAAALGLGSATVADLTSFLASLSEAGKTQHTKRAAAPLSTKERNATGHRVLQTVALVAGAGMIAFADDPTTYASFDALLVPARRRPARKKKSAAAEPPKTEPAVPVTEAASDPAASSIDEAPTDSP